MHNGRLNNTRYDDSGKPIKKSRFKVKNLEGTILREQSTISNKSL